MEMKGSGQAGGNLPSGRVAKPALAQVVNLCHPKGSSTAQIGRSDLGMIPKVL